MAYIYNIKKREVINAVTGVLYDLHPYHHPEGIDAIIDKIDEFYETSELVKHKKFLEISEICEFENIIGELLKSIPEFNQLNISRKLKDEGVTDPDDPKNKGFIVTSIYDKNDDRYTDFIDLDAAIQNITHQIFAIKQYDDDCFLCEFAKSYGSMDPGSE